MKTIHCLLLATFFLFIFSCNKSENSDSKSELLQVRQTAPAEANKVADIELSKTDSTGGISLQGTPPGQNPDWDKKIIKTAFLKLQKSY